MRVVPEKGEAEGGDEQRTRTRKWSVSRVRLKVTPIWSAVATTGSGHQLSHGRTSHSPMARYTGLDKGLDCRVKLTLPPLQKGHLPRTKETGFHSTGLLMIILWSCIHSFVRPAGGHGNREIFQCRPQGWYFDGWGGPRRLVECLTSIAQPALDWKLLFNLGTDCGAHVFRIWLNYSI